MEQPERRILIVGGVAGGASAAARARRLCERCEIVVFDDRVRPNGLDQHSPRDGFAGVLDEVDEDVERLRSQWDSATRPHELAMRRLEAKVPELVDFCRHPTPVRLFVVRRLVFFTA